MRKTRYTSLNSLHSAFSESRSQYIYAQERMIRQLLVFLSLYALLNCPSCSTSPHIGRASAQMGRCSVVLHKCGCRWNNKYHILVWLMHACHILLFSYRTAWASRRAAAGTWGAPEEPACGECIWDGQAGHRSAPASKTLCQLWIANTMNLPHKSKCSPPHGNSRPYLQAGSLCGGFVLVVRDLSQEVNTFLFRSIFHNLKKEKTFPPLQR